MSMSLFNDYIEEGLDTCKFVKDGMEYTAIIDKVSDNSLLVKPIQKTNWKDVFQNNLQNTFEHMILHIKEFDEIKLELWMDGRGCDNSAIGVSGCYEPYTCLTW
jgi:hypothetical protein